LRFALCCSNALLHCLYLYNSTSAQHVNITTELDNVTFVAMLTQLAEVLLYN